MMPSLPPSRLPNESESGAAGDAAAVEASGEGTGAGEATRRLTWKRFFIETVIVFGLAIPLALGLHTFVTQVYAISGCSMEPTLHHGERVVIDKISSAFTDLDVGDMVIFSSPVDAQKNLVKRVIGVEGDRIVLQGDQLFRNGERIDEPYAHLGLYGNRDREWVVPEGEIFVLGDNRPQSKDSRDFGTVSSSSVRGKVVLRLWPLDAITTF